ncbi:hypothetical protein I79_024122 [Cricetulus griseus]|uniref:Uncharacterized protein n=1 Tax=Cricetulus griseus TaxID=10029 RepID=G3IJT5_CRIGR|nr:hypothetical protein I79_024122 [Cricetulus griseus]
MNSVTDGQLDNSVPDISKFLEKNKKKKGIIMEPYELELIFKICLVVIVVVVLNCSSLKRKDQASTARKIYQLETF